MNTEKNKIRSIDEIARRLIATRKAIGLSQIEFARRAGIADNTYNQYETGKSRISLDFAFKLCDAYNLTLDWIYNGDPSGLPFRLVENLHRSAS